MTKYFTSMFLVLAAVAIGSSKLITTNNGLWTTSDKHSTISVTSDTESSYIGFFKNQEKAKPCEFAIVVNNDEVFFQIIHKGKIHYVPTRLLTKLKNIDGCECEGDGNCKCGKNCKCQ